MEHNVIGFFNYILLPALRCAILALNLLIESYSAGGGNVSEFLKGLMAGFALTIWLVCLYNWGVVTSIIKGKSRK